MNYRLVIKLLGAVLVVALFPKANDPYAFQKVIETQGLEVDESVEELVLDQVVEEELRKDEQEQGDDDDQ